jgi:Ricin-type beta-trefoil lectin domain.
MDRDGRRSTPADSGVLAVWESDSSLAETTAQAPPVSAGPDKDERGQTSSGRTRMVYVGAALGAAAMLAVPFLAANSDSSSKGDHTRPLKAADASVGAYLPQPQTVPSSAAPSRSASPSGNPSTPSVPARSPSLGNARGPASGAHKDGHSTANRIKQPTVSVPAVFAGANNMLLKNLGTGYCADVPTNDPGSPYDPVQQYQCQPGPIDNQMWSLRVTSGPKGPGGARLFVIRNTKDGLCMDLPTNDPQAAGTKVIEYSCDGTTGDNQLWYLAYGHQNHYQIRNLTSHGLCLGVTGGTGAGSEARLQIESCGSTAEDWGWSTQ